MASFGMSMCNGLMACTATGFGAIAHNLVCVLASVHFGDSILEERIAPATATTPHKVWNRQWLWRTQLDAPLLGLMFSPRFGQSYYEIFTVESRPRFYATYPLNAPSMRLLSTISLPLRHQRFSVGFQVNVRQSDIQELKRHAWNVAFVVGYTRTLNFLD